MSALIANEKESLDECVPYFAFLETDEDGERFIAPEGEFASNHWTNANLIKSRSANSEKGILIVNF